VAAAILVGRAIAIRAATSDAEQVVRKSRLVKQGFISTSPQNFYAYLFKTYSS
jgi:hypothetical protein